MPALIGFTGRIGSGKDEACRQLDDWCEKHGLLL